MEVRAKRMETAHGVECQHYQAQFLGVSGTNSVTAIVRCGSYLS